MRWLYYGPRYGISTQALSFTQVTDYDKSTSLHSLEAEIYFDSESPCLGLRLQDIKLVSCEGTYLLVPEEDEQSTPLLFQACAHIRDAELSSSIEHFVEAYRSGKVSSPSRKTCDKCNTDYQLELHEHGKFELALIMTKWINLGSGLSPEDPRWKVHSWHAQFPDDFALDSKYMVSSPRLMFEDAAEISFENMHSRNLAYLTDWKYERVMEEIPGYIQNPQWGHPWVLWNKEL